MKDKIVILGSNGQLGSALTELYNLYAVECLALDYPEIDLSKPESYCNKISQYEPETLINCAAYTDVYSAETDIESAMRLNGNSLKNLADFCNKEEIYLIHISTDYVFSGNKESAYTEHDIPDPVNIYGITKYVGEKLIQLYSKKYAIIRTSALYGKSKKKNSQNIVKKLVSLAINGDTIKLVNDEFTSPTYARNLAEQIKLISEYKIQGIVHASNIGSCNWVEFGKCLFDLLKIDIKIEAVSSSFFNVNLKKANYSELENSELNKLGINIMLKWETALKQYIDNDIKHLIKEVF